MEFQQAFDIVLGVAGFLAAFVFNTMWRTLDAERQARASLEKEIATNYVRRDDFTSHVNKVEAALLRIEDKLSSTARRARSRA